MWAKDPSDLNTTDVAQLQQLRTFAQSVRNDPSHEMLGAAQLAWAEAETRKSAASGTAWTLYGHGTVMLPNYQTDFERGIQMLRDAGEGDKANEFEAIWRSVSTTPPDGTTYFTKSYGTMCGE